MAAIDIRGAVELFNEQHADRQLPTRIGLHAGNVAIGNIGGGGHLAFSVVGDSINTASRVQELNKVVGTQVLVTDSVVDQLTEWLFRRICSFRPKGKMKILSVFEIFGPQASAAREDCELCLQFDAAMESFESGDWASAAKLFKQVLANFPDDGPSQFYLERCGRYAKSSPRAGEASLIH
jgi:adenylate cyclase